MHMDQFQKQANNLSIQNQDSAIGVVKEKYISQL